MKKLIFLFAFSIAVTNIFAQTDPNQIKKEGNDAFNAKNYPVAYAKFSEYLKQTNNQDSATAYYCGIAADEVKKYAEAVSFFDIAIQKKFNTGNAYARKALALDALKKTDEYVATLEEGLKVDPNNKTMIKNYGLHYLKAGLAAQKAGKAEEAEEITKQLSLRKEYEAALPDILIRLADIETAAELLDKALLRKLKMLKLTSGMDSIRKGNSLFFFVSRNAIHTTCEL